MNCDNFSGVPLVRVDVEATINDFCGVVHIKQEYINESDKPISVKYVFPIDEAGRAVLLSLETL